MKEVPKKDAPLYSGGARSNNGLVIPGMPDPDFPQNPLGPTCLPIPDPTKITVEK